MLTKKQKPRSRSLCFSSDTLARVPAFCCFLYGFWKPIFIAITL